MAYAQTVFTDSSPDGSPLTFSTSVEDGFCLLHGHNSNPRPIVAWVVSFYGTGTDGKPFTGGMNTDYLFGNDEYIVQHGYDFTTDYPCRQLRSTDDATITTTFVQFDDGSWWGSKDEAQRLAENRQDAIDYLKKLQAALDLKEALSKPPEDIPGKPWIQGSSDQWARITHGNLKTPEEMADYVNEHLAFAEQHKGWLDALRTSQKSSEKANHRSGAKSSEVEADH